MTSWPATAFALSLILPSTLIVHKFLGLWGVLAYAVIAFVVLSLVHRHFFDRLVPGVTPRMAIALGLVLVSGLVLAFWVGYPIANSGLFGPGNDRDENIQIATTELLNGRYPYYKRDPVYDNFISQMPGALIFAAPFVLLGNGAYQNLFWLLAAGVVVTRIYGDLRPAVLLAATVLAFAPEVLREYVTGGDLLANSIYVLLFMIWLLHIVPQRGAATWKKLAAAAAFGIALSSRAHFSIVLPLVFSALVQRAGRGAAVGYVAAVIVACGAVTLPFYLYDPAGFSPLWTISLLQPPEMSRAADAGFLIACGALSLWLAMDRANGNLHVLLQHCALVLAIPILASIPFEMLDTGEPDYAALRYALSFVFFGAVGFMPIAFGTTQGLRVTERDGR